MGEGRTILTGVEEGSLQRSSTATTARAVASTAIRAVHTLFRLLPGNIISPARALLLGVLAAGLWPGCLAKVLQPL